MVDWLEHKYAMLIQPHVELFKVKKENLINIRCPFCGDSATRKHIARGYLYEKDNHFKYVCHNCGLNYNFSYFLKLLDHNLFRQYKFEKFGSKRKPNAKPVFKEVKEELKKRKNNIESLFEPLSDSAKYYLKSRSIENSVDLFSISDTSKFQQFFPEYETLPKDERIVFPIRNRGKEVVGVTARSIDPKNKLRYVLLNYKNEPLIYGLDKVDISKDVYVFEGAIDSLHVKNSVAVNGSDLKKVTEFIPMNKLILVFDNQPRNDIIIKKMISACQSGYRMVIWPNNLDEKDANAIVQKHGQEKLNELLKNVYSGFKCRARISSWRKR